MLMNRIWGDLLHKFIGIKGMPSAAEAFSAKSLSCGFSSFSAFLFSLSQYLPQGLVRIGSPLVLLQHVVILAARGMAQFEAKFR